MSVEESKHKLSASELKPKKKEEKRRLKESKKKSVDDTKSKKRSRDDVNEEKQHDEYDNADKIEEDGETEKRSRKKRKSVSFADNITIENKDQTNDTGEDKKNDGDDNTSPTENEEQSRERRKKEKREKREQRRKHDGQKAATITSTKGDKQPTTDSVDNKSILAYLSQYYNDRASWKFQKIREAQLLKHVFSLDHVPSEYNPALLAYLKGLKSEGARTRLRKSAQEVIKHDEKHITATSETADETTTEETNDIAKLPVLPESLREAYGDAVYRFKGNLNAGIKNLNEGVSLTVPNGDNNENSEVDANVLARLEHRKRAEMVQWTVSGRISKFASASEQQDKQTEPESEPTGTTTASAAKKENKQKAPARKKRKNRTMIVEISSSSESSDSDSD
ncbi:hypothetical protein TSTA_031610 [Talaromyces stipitatus ATCC 10500]|uniref:WKF domain-containing protein n=1 Tax=Talaromyces stipitatus (strain ATCC 10500 / CBS 375.48 / QM 6759 / NRRL 1006) TaxID=441959 RepID=B8M5K8_TALSN|nr:uncharacterized protein TSTA_031610 [Talaromyces stipitatus ATCC 10500]EED19902.1 hypothetical protein TSTA_031610 [Talaromyces stipitatus ATCC 10500]